MADLRPYQAAVIEQVSHQFAVGHKRLLVEVPTGGGKTVIAAKLIADEVAARRRVLFVAHRRELIHQAHRKLYDAGVDAGVILAGHPARPHEAVQVASIATLHARAIRSTAMELPDADLVVVDEAHHARAETYRAVIARYPDARIVGLTATPCRGDGRGLGNVFEVIVSGPSVAELTAAGFLVPARIYAPSRPDLKGVETRAGDYVESQLAQRVDQPELVGDIVSHWFKLAERRRTVVFAAGVGHSLHLRDQFRAGGVLAEHIDGSTPAEDRDQILARLAQGSIDVVCNAAVLTEGWDSPEVSALILARPTKSLGLYRQMVGRILRPAPGKTDALILDHAGAVFMHGFPDDAIVWTLDEDRRAENRAHSGRGQGSMPALVDCPECHAIRLQGQPCPACGWRPRQKPQAVEVAEGNLGRVERNRSVQDVQASAMERRNFHRQLVYIAMERGYSGGWAAHKFKEKFGDWPADRHAQPMEPDPAVRAWVKSRQIAYAKAMDKQRASA